ncbi:N-acetylmuramoyl-L-alanine amidase [Candidatus Parcubacteria bacterium]|nr:MAG: N-acetylmuramoyl-L-alanine amidase [Candidatus Parcubacteria bacterium]
MRTIKEIIIHCSATRPDWMKDAPLVDKVAEIDRWHRERGFAGIGYHFVIDRDGAVAKGRDINKVGAHTKGHNKYTVGVCLLGGYESKKTDPFLKNFTRAQDSALRELLDDLKKQIKKPVKISGHNQYANKECPGFIVSEWLIAPPKKPLLAVIVEAVINFLAFWKRKK